MRKRLGTAVAAAVLVTGGGLLHAMDYRIGFQAKTDGGWSPFAFRTSDYSDEKAAEAHILEIDGKPAQWSNGSYTVPVGDAQILDPSSYGYTGAYEDGFALWAGGIKGFRFQPMFQGTSNSGSFYFGARFMVKCKEYDAFNGNGWSTWLGYKNFEVKAATTGGLGYGAYVGTGGSFITATSALYAWQLTEYNQYFKGPKNGSVHKGNIDDYNYFGYQVSNAGLGVENISDKATAVGIQWTQKVRGGQDTLNLRLANMHHTNSGGSAYADGRDWNTTYPVGWHVQANYRMPSWTFSGTYKIRGANSASTDKYEKPEAFNMAGHFGVSTNRIPNLTLSAGYAFFAEEVGDSAEKTIDDVAYSTEIWGHNFGLSAGYRLREWSFNLDNTTSLILLSDYMKAKSSANHYAWKPYLGTTVSFSAHKRINGLLNGHISAGFTDANMNSYTDGKGEAELWLHPNVDISPARGVNVNIALHCALQNFSDRAIGWWSDYNSDSDFGNKAGEVYYTYPHTFTVTIPISLSISI